LQPANTMGLDSSKRCSHSENLEHLLDSREDGNDIVYADEGVGDTGKFASCRPLPRWFPSEEAV